MPPAPIWASRRYRPESRVPTGLVTADILRKFGGEQPRPARGQEVLLPQASRASTNATAVAPAALAVKAPVAGSGSASTTLVEPSARVRRRRAEPVRTSRGRASGDAPGSG